MKNNQINIFSPASMNLGPSNFGFVPSGSGAPPPNPWTRREIITIDHTKVVGSDLTDFPVAFFGTYAFLKSVANGGVVTDANGYDIGFFSDAACTTKLKWELVFWDPATGQVEFHFKAPTVSTSVDTLYYLGAGNAAIVTDQSDPTAVWTSNYRYVGHLANGTVLSAADSTSNNNDGALGAFGPDPTTGQMDGGALAVNGFSPTVNLGNGASLEFNQVMSLSLWASFSSLGILQNVICKGAEDYRLRLNITSLDIGSYDGADHQASYAIPFAVDTIHFISGGYDGTAWRLFVDGVQVAFTVDPVGALPNAGTNCRLMSSAGGIDRFMEGMMDEPRIMSTYLGANWWATEYNNQFSPSTFYSLTTI